MKTIETIKHYGNKVYEAVTSINPRKILLAGALGLALAGSVNAESNMTHSYKPAVAYQKLQRLERQVTELRRELKSQKRIFGVYSHNFDSERDSPSKEDIKNLLKEYGVDTTKKSDESRHGRRRFRRFSRNMGDETYETLSNPKNKETFKKLSETFGLKFNSDESPYRFAEKLDQLTNDEGFYSKVFSNPTIDANKRIAKAFAKHSYEVNIQDLDDLVEVAKDGPKLSKLTTKGVKFADELKETVSPKYKFTANQAEAVITGVNHGDLKSTLKTLAGIDYSIDDSLEQGEVDSMVSFANAKNSKVILGNLYSHFKDSGWNFNCWETDSVLSLCNSKAGPKKIISTFKTLKDVGYTVGSDLEPHDISTFLNLAKTPKANDMIKAFDSRFNGWNFSHWETDEILQLASQFDKVVPTLDTLKDVGYTVGSDLEPHDISTFLDLAKTPKANDMIKAFDSRFNGWNFSHWETDEILQLASQFDKVVPALDTLKDVGYTVSSDLEPHDISTFLDLAKTPKANDMIKAFDSRFNGWSFSHWETDEILQLASQFDKVVPALDTLKDVGYTIDSDLEPHDISTILSLAAKPKARDMLKSMNRKLGLRGWRFNHWDTNHVLRLGAEFNKVDLALDNLVSSGYDISSSLEEQDVENILSLARTPGATKVLSTLSMNFRDNGWRLNSWDVSAVNSLAGTRNIIPAINFLGSVNYNLSNEISSDDIELLGTLAKSTNMAGTFTELKKQFPWKY